MEQAETTVRGQIPADSHHTTLLRGLLDHSLTIYPGMDDYQRISRQISPDTTAHVPAYFGFHLTLEMRLMEELLRT
jgi:hypothetical protein